MASGPSSPPGLPVFWLALPFLLLHGPSQLPLPEDHLAQVFAMPFLAFHVSASSSSKLDPEQFLLYHPQRQAHC